MSGLASQWCKDGMDGWKWVQEGAAGGSDMGEDGWSGRGEFRDLRGSTAGLEGEKTGYFRIGFIRLVATSNPESESLEPRVPIGVGDLSLLSVCRFFIVNLN